MDRGTHEGYSPWGCKESDMTEQLKCTHMSLIIYFSFWDVVTEGGVMNVIISLP